ncbi:hypothetical protein P43SY_006662 [Pythium insidiosum]|uniref:Uncharacterized protein n=1 Tax=Pythium insidiosum TaxID=114742 RepID=A0AAD5LCC7_PYTIN|nr:hypothetical protein P43SY_006662 [Pythium insidiosum]
MDDVTAFKLVAIASIWLIGLGGGLLPSLLATRRRQSPVVAHLLAVLNAFSGGVFLAGGFFHLLHAAVENEGLQRWSTMDDGRYEFPYAEMFSSLGFLGLLLLEQLAHSHLQDDDKDSNVDDGESTALTDDYLEDSSGDDPEAQALRVPGDFDGHAKHSHAGHSHMPLPTADGQNSPAVAIVLFIALSFHSVMEGLGLGAQTSSAWGVFLAIILHKGLAAFALGTGLVQSALPRAHVTAYMVLFSFMSVVGIVVGWAIAAGSSEDSAAAGICVALASGTFIYVAVMEVIPQEFGHHQQQQHARAIPAAVHRRNMRHKTVALCLGYAVFGLLAKWS